MTRTQLIIGSVPIGKIELLMSNLQIAGDFLPEPMDLTKPEHIFIATTKEELLQGGVAGLVGAQPAVAIARSKQAAQVLRKAAEHYLFKEGAVEIDPPPTALDAETPRAAKDKTPACKGKARATSPRRTHSPMEIDSSAEETEQQHSLKQGEYTKMRQKAIH